MILELVEFNSPKGWSRQQVAEEARNVIPHWQANKDLLRKHFLLELNGRTGGGARRDVAAIDHQAHRHRAHHPLFRSVPADRQ